MKKSKFKVYVFYDGYGWVSVSLYPQSKADCAIAVRNFKRNGQLAEMRAV